MWVSLLLKLRHCSDTQKDATGFPKLFKQLRAYLPPNSELRSQVQAQERRLYALDIQKLVEKWRNEVIAHHTITGDFKIFRQSNSLSLDEIEPLIDELSKIPHSTEFSGGVDPSASKASRREDLPIEEPVCCGYSPAFHFHAALTGMLGPTLIGDQVIQMSQPCEKRLLTAAWMVKRFHHEQFPFDRMMGLIQQRAGHGHPRIFAHRIPARFLLVYPVPHALAIGRSSRSADVNRKATQPLAECKHAQAVALSCSVPQGVKLRA
jgi:hypothetical protein